MLSRSENGARTRLIIFLCFLIFGLSLSALFVGPMHLSIHEVFTGLFSLKSETGLIVRELRLPRLILSLGFGAGLGVCGAAA